MRLPQRRVGLISRGVAAAVARRAVNFRDPIVCVGTVCVSRNRCRAPDNRRSSRDRADWRLLAARPPCIMPPDGAFASGRDSPSATYVNNKGARLNEIPRISSGRIVLH